MKKFILTLILLLSFGQMTFANAAFDLKRIKEWNKVPEQNIPAKNTNSKTLSQDKKVAASEKNKNNKDKEKQIKKPLTNYEYDDMNYKYNKYYKYIQDNIDYSNTSEKIKFN